VGALMGARIYSATLTGTEFESLGQYGSLTRTESEHISIGLTESGQLATLYLPGFVFFPDALADLSRAGDHVDFSGTFDVGGVTASYTLGITLRTVSFGETSASGTIDATLYSIGGSLVQEGTGVQTFELSWDDATMSYSSSTNYNMVFRPAPGVDAPWYFEPVQRRDFSGTLRR
jgi:hypothetical protein